MPKSSAGIFAPVLSVYEVVRVARFRTERFRNRKKGLLNTEGRAALTAIKHIVRELSAVTEMSMHGALFFFFFLFALAGIESRLNNRPMKAFPNRSIRVRV